MSELVFLKLGGSLITDKSQPYTPRLDILANLANEIASVLQRQPNLSLVLGHGSGSFGHTAARQYKTKDGISFSTESADKNREVSYWNGFAEVWYQASRLNRHVVQALHEKELSIMTFSPSASIMANDGQIIKWNISPINIALENGIIPIVHGDVIFDKAKGGTILSTEEMFGYLAKKLHPTRILLAGFEEAIYADFPARKQKVHKLTRKSFNTIYKKIGKSVNTDVTGGMEAKVSQMLELSESIPGLAIQIFSGEKHGNIEKACLGEHLGTLIRQ